MYRAIGLFNGIDNGWLGKLLQLKHYYIVETMVKNKRSDISTLLYLDINK